MLKLPAPQFRPHQHILPPYVKYIAIWAIILLAVTSSYLPFSSELHARSNYRNTITIKNSKRVKPVALSNTRVRKNNSVAIRKDQSTRILNGITPKTATPTLTPEKNQSTVLAPKKEAQPAPVQSEPHVPVVAIGNADQGLLATLNAYRQKNGKSALFWDSTLASFAKERANKFDVEGRMDSHQGFSEMLANDGFNRMGFNALAENSSFGDTRDPVYIIEMLYGQSAGHNENQLSSEYTHVGIGATGKATDFVFGGRKK